MCYRAEGENILYEKIPLHKENIQKYIIYAKMGICSMTIKLKPFAQSHQIIV